MTAIHSTEIWSKSQCLTHEDQINRAIGSRLQRLGYHPTEHFRIWAKQDRRVIVCLVDDIRSCSNDYHVDMPYLYDRNTTVITDNYLTCPTQFPVLRLPHSFFGIYSYEPLPHAWSPEQQFAFQVNRIDPRRFQLMTDLAWRTRLDSGYINFNCEDRSGQNLTATEAFEQFWPNLDDNTKNYMQAGYDKIRNSMPFKNYDYEFDLVPYKVWINLVVETYASDNVVTLSEKIFRALVTAAPWTVYCGRYTVAYLESLGFDCMSDIIDHNHYDRLKEVENKLRIFNWKSLEIAKGLQELGADRVRQRCLEASRHNQALLKNFGLAWSRDFSSWLDTVSNQLAQ